MNFVYKNCNVGDPVCFIRSTGGHIMPLNDLPLRAADRPAYRPAILIWIIHWSVLCFASRR